MSMFAGGSNSNADAQQKVTGVSIQTSAYNRPITLLYGQARTGQNLIQIEDFLATKKDTGGGKGGGGKGGNQGSYTYTATIIAGICEGPVSGFVGAWGNSSYLLAAQIGSSYHFFTGAFGQSTWSYMTGAHPTDARPYSGVCYNAWQPYPLTTSGTMYNQNIEVKGLLWGTAPNSVDAACDQVVVDMLTDVYHGLSMNPKQVGELLNRSETRTIATTVTITDPVAWFLDNLSVEIAGVPMTCVASAPAAGQYSYSAGVYTFNAANVGTSCTINYMSVNPVMNLYKLFCNATGMWISPAYEEQNDAASMLSEIADLTYSEWIYHCGVLQLVPRGEQSVTGNGFTYPAPGNPLFNLFYDDMMEDQGGNHSPDPISIHRSQNVDHYNVVNMEYMDRTNQYAASTVECPDLGLIGVFGRRPQPVKQAHIFADGVAANTSAQFQLQKLYNRNQYSFTLDRRYIVLDPMDIVTITDDGLVDHPTSRIPLDQKAVRILEITENEDGSFTFLAEEYLGNLGAGALVSFTNGQGYEPDFNVAPGPVTDVVLLEPPISFFAGTPQLMIGVTGGPSWGGCDIYISTDNVNFKYYDHIATKANLGFTTTAIVPLVSGTDTTSTITVNLTVSQGSLPSGSSHSSADNFQTSFWLCDVTTFANGEMIGFGTGPTLTGSFTYQLKAGGVIYLPRGQLGSIPVAHAIGSPFMFFDSNVYSTYLPPAYVGVTLYLKFVSVNIYGTSAEDISTVSTYTFVPVSQGGGSGISGTPPVPTGLSGGPDFYIMQDGTIVQSIIAAWTPGVNVNLTGQEINYKLASASTWTSVIVSSSADHYTIPAVASNTNYNIRVRSVSNQSTGVVYSAWAPNSTGITVNSNQNSGSPSVPAAPTLTPDYELMHVNWSLVADTNIAGYDVFYNTVNNSGTATAVAPRPGPLTTACDIPGLLTNQTYFVWIRSVNTYGVASSLTSVRSATTTLVAAPTGLGASSTFAQAADGTIVPSITWAWSAPTDPTAGGAPVDHAEVQWQQHAVGTWTNDRVVDIAATSYTWQPVPTGIVWDMRVRFIRTTTNGRFFSAWTTLNSAVTSVGKSSLPSTVTGFAAIGCFRSITATWTEVSDSDIDYYDLGYSTLGTTLNGVLMSVRTTSASYVQNILGSTWLPLGIWLWVRAVNKSGIVGNWNAGSGAFPTTGGTHVFPITVINGDASNNAWTVAGGGSGTATGTGIGNQIAVTSFTFTPTSNCTAVVTGFGTLSSSTLGWIIELDVNGVSGYAPGGTGGSFATATTTFALTANTSYTFNLTFWGAVGQNLGAGRLSVSILMK